MIQSVYGKDAMSRSREFEWFSRFACGRDSTEDDHRSSRVFTNGIVIIKKTIGLDTNGFEEQLNTTSHEHKKGFISIL